jgi:hypothetical protein
LEIDILVGWLLCAGGIARIVTLYGKQHLPGLWWPIFSGFIAIVFATPLFGNPDVDFLRRPHQRRHGIPDLAGMAGDSRLGCRPLCRRLCPDGG